MKKLTLLILLIMIPVMVFAYIQGDVNGKNGVTILDYLLVRKHANILTVYEKERADVNNDGIVSAADYNLIRKIIMGEMSPIDISPSPTPTVTPTIRPTITPSTTNYSCTGTITSFDGTVLTVSPEIDIYKYEWIINGKTIKGNSTYKEYKIIDNVKVNLTLNNGEKKEVSCTINNKLVYRFKYDEYNKKPFMKCNTYTSIDKLKYDNMLKQVINDAGYGTRAGVVEAARFLVGALDYKVPYQGSSKYNKKGLNIGQKGAWGCSGIGLDCYYFVHWVLSQNGLPLGSLYAGKKYNTVSEIGKIKVGDYLLTPCNSDTCKNEFKINHIGLVIGIDNNFIYVAEATTGNINALVVTKLDKHNLPKNGKLSLVHHTTYDSDGKVTNMWLEE